MSHIAVSNKTLNFTVASNALSKIGIKVSVLMLLRNSQMPVGAPLPTSGIQLLFFEEAEVKMPKMVDVMSYIKEHVTCHDCMVVASSIHKGTPNAKRFNNNSVLSGWYQAWISRII